MEERLVGWVAYEEIGIGFINPIAFTPSGCLYVGEESEVAAVRDGIVPDHPSSGLEGIQSEDGWVSGGR